jgi:hypothetical protein
MRKRVKAYAPKKESNKPLGGSCERLRTGVWIKRKDHVTFFRGFKALALVGRIDRLIRLLVFLVIVLGGARHLAPERAMIREGNMH